MARNITALLLVLLLAALVFPGCRPGRPTPAEGEIGVVASFYPLYEAARQVGGEKAAVQSLVPPGTESHDFEPTPKDIAALLGATIVIYNGAGFEPWLERLLPDLKGKRVVLVDASQSVEVLTMSDEDNPAKKVPDPHFWLDPVLMPKVVLAVRNAYTQVDPQNRAVYEANAAAYTSKLESLHQQYQGELQGYQKRTIVTSHAAFSYLVRRYNLEMIPIAGLSPVNEPSPQQMAAIVRVVRERGIKHIFFETLVDPRLAEAIAREVGAGTLVLNPLEGLTDQEMRAGKDYISVMEENLVNLKKALEAVR